MMRKSKPLLKKLTEIVADAIRRQQEHGMTIRLMFQDEACFGRINKTRRCWAPVKIRPDTLHQVVREYTYVYAAVSPHDGVMDSLVLPEANSEAMSLFLREVSDRHNDELIIMVLDGAGWHRAKDLDVPENMRLIFLPPYSPQLNPVEHIWDEIREKWFTNKAFRDLDSVQELLVKALVTLENDHNLVQNTAGFNWIVSINLNAN